MLKKQDVKRIDTPTISNLSQSDPITPSQEPEQPKALFRRAKALLALKEHQEAGPEGRGSLPSGNLLLGGLEHVFPECVAKGSRL